MMGLLINIVLGLLGIVLYTLIKVWALLKSNEGINFDPEVFYKDNRLSWYISSAIIVVLTLILYLVPEAVEILQTILPGYEMKNSPLGFLGLGMFLSFMGKTGITAYKKK